MPGLQIDDQAKAAACGADLFQPGVIDVHAGPAVDQEQSPFKGCKLRGPFSDHGIEHRPNAELFGAVALQRHFRDAAFDDLEPEPTVPDVLRRNDRPAQMKTSRAIDVADRGRHRGQIGLRHVFPEIGLIGRCEPVARDRRGARDGNAAEEKYRLGACPPLRSRKLRRRYPGPAGRRLIGLLPFEPLFGLYRVIAGLARLLRRGRQAG